MTDPQFNGFVSNAKKQLAEFTPELSPSVKQVFVVLLDELVETRKRLAAVERTQSR